MIWDWSGMGWTGWGAKSFAVKYGFVPDRRLIDKADTDRGQSPGTRYYEAPVAKRPRGGVSAVSYTAVVVGVAQGFLRNFYNTTGPRTSRGNSDAMQPGIQLSVGQAAAEIEAAELMYLGAIRETM